MTVLDAAYGVIFVIGMAVVGWCVNRIVSQGERIARVEEHVRKCKLQDCDET
jgi:hypothetical protein